MKYTGLLALTLAAVAVANPMPKGKAAAANAGAANAAAAKAGGNANAAANAQQVSDDINKWLQDIQAVNDFVDTAGNLKSNQEISDAAATAFVAAQDEGTQNDNLQKLTQLDASGLAAATDLLNQFGIIGPAINDTISNPQNLQKNLDAINGARCPPPAGNGAIFEEGAVQQSAAAAAGVQADLPALPNACADLAQKVLDAGAAGAAAAGAAKGAAAGAAKGAGAAAAKAN